MKKAFSQHINRYFFMIGAGSFLLMSFLGLSHAVMDRHGEMLNCPFMSETILCQMTPLQHLSAWQSMFTQVSIKEIFNAFVFLLLSSILSFAFTDFWYRKYQLEQSLYFKSRTPPIFIPNLIQEAFSNGILNPRIH